eukprot:2333204-Prymnesium_polylepis.2
MPRLLIPFTGGRLTARQTPTSARGTSARRRRSRRRCCSAARPPTRCTCWMRWSWSLRGSAT